MTCALHVKDGVNGTIRRPPMDPQCNRCPFGVAGCPTARARRVALFGVVAAAPIDPVANWRPPSRTACALLPPIARGERPIHGHRMTARGREAPTTCCRREAARQGRADGQPRVGPDARVLDPRRAGPLPSGWSRRRRIARICARRLPYFHASRNRQFSSSSSISLQGLVVGDLNACV